MFNYLGAIILYGIYCELFGDTYVLSSLIGRVIKMGQTINKNGWPEPSH
jgi:hypothetical protein